MLMYSFISSMNLKLLTISQVAKILGVSIQTLRRWDSSGKLFSTRPRTTGHRYYLKSDIEDYIKNNSKELFLFKMALNWVMNNLGVEPFSDFYCSNVSVFQTRLIKLENELSKIKRLSKIFPLISAITGEIGNNSFDHNLGNWPDILGIFFAWDLDRGKIILADRGQGILSTLKKVKPELTNHQDALLTAFTEVISGRAPEHRGNGLKFVRDVVIANKISLFFQTGNAWLKIQKNDSNMVFQKSAAQASVVSAGREKKAKLSLSINFRGCLSLIKF